MNRKMILAFVTGLLFGAFAQLSHAAEARPVVGAIRWDAWYGESGPVTEVERSLGPKKFHFRLPFFAQVLGDNQVRINGDNERIMEQEIAFAAEAGLNYWAFVDYGDDGNLTIARKRYQAARNKRGLRFCFVEEGSRLDSRGTNGWPRLVKFFQDPDYQRVLEGRPLLFVFGAPKHLGKREFQQLCDLTTAAGLKRPYLVFMGWNPDRDAETIKGLGFDAWSAYAAGGQYAGKMASYEQLTGLVRKNYWEACRRLGLPTITFATLGWDTRPRLEHPVSWMPNIVRQSDPTPPAEQQPLIDGATASPLQISRHVEEAIAWTEANRESSPAQAVILYAWNENDEGGWVIPTLNPQGSTNFSRVKALNSAISGNKG